MRFSIIPSAFMLLLIWMIPAHAQQDGGSFESILKNADASQAMAIANEWKWSKKGITSYVTSREVVFKFPDGKVEKVPLPDDKFLVAVAPYVKRTHQWTIHYMSSCQGELSQQPFNVKAMDNNGEILIDETLSTLRNGFFELWLPRNRKIILQVKGMNGTAMGLIETYDRSKTCVTTFRLR